MYKIIYISTVLLLSLAKLLPAQVKAEVKLKIFIEGRIPDFNYLRSNMPFVDFVNDPHSSDVHVIVTRENTASGGRHYYITFIPVTVESVKKLTLNCITAYQDTDDVERYKFTQSIKSGVLIFINEKQLHYQIDVIDNQSLNGASSEIANTVDPWNNWVFNIGVNGGLELEEQKKDFGYDATLEANRITNKWKIQNEYEYEREETYIETDDEASDNTIHAFNLEQKLYTRVTRSLSSHWSTGLFLSAYQTTYRNMQFRGEATAAVEYNIYPWSQINRRTFTIAYFVGPGYFDYYERTLLNKTSEWLWKENLKIDLQKIEQWGELELWLAANHYFPDFTYYSVETGIELSIRIAKGLSFEFETAIEKINNQLYLQAGEFSNEDILLNTRKLPTSFEFNTQIGIQYRFGSMYNNVVNRRL